MTSHSKLAPSSAARRMACSASRILEEQFQVPQDTTAAAEGDLAHKVASDFVEKMIHLNTGNAELSYLLDEPGVTEEMREGAGLYWDTIYRECMWKQRDRWDYAIEKTITITSIHEDCFGTPDFWHHNYATPETTIIDYKFGHLNVEAFENWQLIEYAAGVLQHLKETPPTNSKVRLIVVQPRCYHSSGQVKIWTTTWATLSYYFGELRASEYAATAEHPEATPSPECRFCKARHACRALQQAALETVATGESSPEGVRLDEKALGTELRLLQAGQKLLEARIDGLEKETEERLRRGESIPHFTLETSKGRDTWNLGENDFENLENITGIKLRKLTAITPHQAMKAGLDESIARMFIQPGKTSVKLAPVDLQKSKQIFGDKS